MSNTPISEGRLIALTASIQFVNILDFMMVMPLGPDFARSLGIPTSDIGLIGGAYTLSAAVVGLLSALFLDRFARKTAVLWALLGLAFATLAGAAVWSRDSMIAVRLLAGVFGGPLTSLCLALIADFIPPERRGQAYGKSMGAFALASVLGVPFGLELSERLSWHAPFVTTGVLALVVWVAVWRCLPHRPALGTAQGTRQQVSQIASLLVRKEPVLSYVLIACIVFSAFSIIPNISAHLQLNLDYPRSGLGLLYFCGGFCTFFGMRMAGKAVDRFSSTSVAAVASAGVVVAMFAGFVLNLSGAWVLPVFVLFMVGAMSRMVSVQTLGSKIPQASERGAYMALQSTVQHMASSLGAWFSSLVLVEAGGRLLHMGTVAWVSMALACAAVGVCYWLERTVVQRQFEAGVLKGASRAV